MSVARKAFKGAIWLVIFRAISQAFSWVATIIVARILVPEDYGLMEMATILTGYVALFSELGLGTAIIQRRDVRDEELSSLFWFMVFWGLIMACVCVILAYPTVAIFREERILRITQSVSVLYVIGAFLIVPLNILHRDLRFKAIGFIDAISLIISCLMMIVIARLGGGVWTLIGGHIIRQFARVILVFPVLSWRPQLSFNFTRIKPYLRFGLTVAAANSLHYVYTKSDRFFGGRMLGANTLGYYSLALQLSAIPNDKLVSLINSVSFPVFSRYQESYDDFNHFYLRLVNIIAFVTFPLYIGGVFLADQLVALVLGSKWLPLIFPFKLLCLSQLIISITTPNAIAHVAQSRPQWSLYMGIINMLFLPLSFYIAAKYGLNALAVPWITAYPLLRFGFTCLTIRKLGISASEYLMNIKHPLFATLTMLLMLYLVRHFYFINFAPLSLDLKAYLFIAIVLGVISYSSYVWIFQRSLLVSLLNLRKG